MALIPIVENKKKSLGIYVHIPFCRSKCEYCDFYSIPGARSRDLMDRYLDAVILHIREAAQGAAGYEVDTVYFGGGTPSFFGAGGLAKIFAEIDRRFDVSRDAEVSLEANPDSVTLPMLMRLRRAGFNRISIGVQSDDDAQLKALGRPQEEVELYARRARNYRNLFDSQTGLMRGRNADGSFAEPFSPFKWGDAFTEGNSWHYTWSVFHDPQGLIDLMGGRERFAGMLDSVFVVPPVFDESYYGSVIHEIREMQVMNMGNYAHGNQPIQHMIYLYNYAGQPWKAQYRLRQVMERFYSATPDGYCGDEDNGQTSAWYVFSALGFYPVCPGSDQYVLGSPLFEKAVVHYEDGRRTVIAAAGNGPGRCYVKSLKINGRDSSKNYLTHGTLTAGGKLEFGMSDRPDLSRGTAPSDAPYSFSSEF